MKRYFAYVWLLLLLASCNPSFFQPREVNYKRYEVFASQPDTALVNLVAPYRDSMATAMNAVIGTLNDGLIKKIPDGSLGYFITDAFLAESKATMNAKTDLAFVNNGGIRINEVPKGTVTVGKIYELMPFDNIMVLVQLTGSQLQEFMNHICGRGGWPIAGGSYTIDANKKAVNILIDGAPLNVEKMYTIALSDYVANGGDDCKMLMGLPQVTTGYLQRDAIINYIKKTTAAGKRISPPVANRINRIN